MFTDVVIQNPINWNHSLNWGLSGCWLHLPIVSGSDRLWDLTGFSNHGTLTANFKNNWAIDGQRQLSTTKTTSLATIDCISTSLKSNGVYTAAGWFCPSGFGTGGSGYNVLFGFFSSGYSFPAFNNSRQVTIWGSGSFEPGGSSLFTWPNDAGTWHHFVLVRTANSGKYRGYLDGVYQGELNAGSNFSTNAIFCIQGRNDAGQGFDGKATDFRLYTNRAFSDAEVLALYNESRQFYPNLLKRVKTRKAVVAGAFYELALDQGSYTQTGQNVSLFHNLVIAPSSRTYLYDGQDVALKETITNTVTVDQGSYTHTGQDVSILLSSIVGVNQGSYTHTGQSIAVSLSLAPLSIDFGSYVYSGQDTGIVLSSTVTVDQGNYTHTGQDTSIVLSSIVSLDQRNYRVTGQTININVNYVLDLSFYIGVNYYVVVGYPGVDVVLSSVVGLDQGTYTHTGQDTNLLLSMTDSVTQGTYTLDGYDVNFVSGETIPTDQGTYTLDGYDVNFTFAYVAVYEQGSYTHTGQDVSILLSSIVGVNQGSYTHTGQSVNLPITSLVICDAGEYSVIGQSQEIIVDVVFVSGQGSYTHTGYDVNFLINYITLLDYETYIINGNDVTLITTIGTFVLEQGQYEHIGYNADITVLFKIIAKNFVIGRPLCSFTVIGLPQVMELIIGISAKTITIKGNPSNLQVLSGRPECRYTVRGQ